jgi:hypothetical protein
MASFTKHQKQAVIRRALTHLDAEGILSYDFFNFNRTTFFTCNAIEFAGRDLYPDKIEETDNLKDEYSVTLDTTWDSIPPSWRDLTPEIQEQRFIHLCSFLYSL